MLFLRYIFALFILGSTLSLAQTWPPVNSAYGPGVTRISQTVDFNVANTDTAFTIVLPPGATRYIMQSVKISGASHDISTATAGVFTATGGGGTAVIAGGSAITVTATADATANNSQSMVTSTTTSYTAGTLYFRVANAEGTAATATVTMLLFPTP